MNFAIERLFYEENHGMFKVPGKISLHRKIPNIEPNWHFELERLHTNLNDTTEEYTNIFNVKDASRKGWPIVQNVDKITEKIEVNRHVSSRSISQELTIEHKTVLNLLRQVGFRKKLEVWDQHQSTPKNVMDRISFYEALAKRNEIDSFLKRMETGDEKWALTTILYENDRGQSAVKQLKQWPNQD
ncbi:histone-lysine N-methyltransferase SETMAR [Trichonephila clavipes]|nr:histone-lysine N-methyltransferase SETMAR [Trichonephila clavipes]